MSNWSGPAAIAGLGGGGASLGAVVAVIVFGPTGGTCGMALISGAAECINDMGVHLEGLWLDKDFQAFAGGLIGTAVGLGVSGWNAYKNRVITTPENERARKDYVEHLRRESEKRAAIEKTTGLPK